MSDASASKPIRPWRVIAEQASHEPDPKKMTQLLAELNHALEKRVPGKHDDKERKSA